MTSPSSPASIVPSYRALVRNFEKPMQHGDGRRFLTNPAIYGQPGRGELFGNVVCANGSYYVAGPGFTGREYDLQTAAITGNVPHYNRAHAAPAQHVYQCASPDAAQVQLWALVVEHYGITDAAEQAAQVQATKQWEQSPEGQAAQAQAQAWLKANHPAAQEPQEADEDILASGDLETALRKILGQPEQPEDELGRLSDQLDAAHEANGKNPAINGPGDWIPDYPDENQDSEEYPEHPSDEQRDDYPDDPQDEEREALGDLYNSQFED